MSTWADGYITDINYTSGFYRETTPLWLASAATFIGHRPPDLAGTYTWCELGCGQGFNAALIAAANPRGRFVAMDFNPAQIDHARRLAAAAGLNNIDFIEASFQDIAEAPTDAFPQFDFITIHGIYSWVSRENLEAIVRFVSRFLKPGGLVYNSYNCHPGWSSFVPAQKLLRLWADNHPDRSDRQVEGGFKYLKALQEAGALYFTSNPAIGERIEKALAQDKNYLAHEYLHQNWFIHDVSDVLKDFALAKCSFIGSATLSENMDQISMPANVHPILGEVSDVGMRESVKDLARNQSFRRDLYRRGIAALPPGEHLRALTSMTVEAIRKAPEGEIKFTVPVGEVTGHANVYGALFALLEKGPLSFNEAAQIKAFEGKTFVAVTQALQLLSHGAHVHPQMPGQIEAGPAQALNRIVAERVLNGYSYAYLAAPTIGSAVSAGQVEMIAGIALFDQPSLRGDDLAEAAWKIFEPAGRRVRKDGKPLETVEENRAEFQRLVSLFEENTLPYWLRLQVVPS